MATPMRRPPRSTACGSIPAPERPESRPTPGRSSVTPGTCSIVSYSQPLSETMFEANAKEPIRVGVIGTGFGASLHLSALRENPDFETVAICSRRPERAQGRRPRPRHPGTSLRLSRARPRPRDRRRHRRFTAPPPSRHGDCRARSGEARPLRKADGQKPGRSAETCSASRSGLARWPWSTTSCGFSRSACASAS